MVQQLPGFLGLNGRRDDGLLCTRGKGDAACRSLQVLRIGILLAVLRSDVARLRDCYNHLASIYDLVSLDQVFDLFGLQFLLIELLQCKADFL